MPSPSRSAIKKWMLRNAEAYFEFGELNCTALVEAWDAECSTGDATLAEDHVAWDVALEVEKQLIQPETR